MSGPFESPKPTGHIQSWFPPPRKSRTWSAKLCAAVIAVGAALVVMVGVFAFIFGRGTRSADRPTVPATPKSPAAASHDIGDPKIAAMQPRASKVPAEPRNEPTKTAPPIQAPKLLEVRPPARKVADTSRDGEKAGGTTTRT